MEVYTRKKCPYVGCVDGVDSLTHYICQKPKRDIVCEICHGEGYIEEWVDIQEILKKLINGVS